MENVLKSIDEVKAMINHNIISVVVLSTRTCSVCKPLKEKVLFSIQEFDNIGYGEVFIEDIPAVQGEYQVFTVPIVLLFVDKKETKRYSAAIDLLQFKQTIQRYCELIK